MIARIRAYLCNLLIAIDQLIGAGLFGIHADMTISAQAWLWHITGKRSWPYKLIDALFFWQEGHCHDAYMSEVQGKQLPQGVRKRSGD